MKRVRKTENVQVRLTPYDRQFLELLGRLTGGTLTTLARAALQGLINEVVGSQRSEGDLALVRQLQEAYWRWSQAELLRRLAGQPATPDIPPDVSAVIDASVKLARDLRANMELTSKPGWDADQRRAIEETYGKPKS